MPNTENFYAGADYGLDPDYPGPDIASVPIAPYIRTSQIGTAVNPQTANQIKAVSDALNTGVKTVEVQMTFPEIEKAIPNQHLKEINRLRQLTGAELTLHGPMVEPTGFNPQSPWSESQREQAERQIWQAVERGHQIDPDGNIVVTLHSSQTLPEPRTRIITPEGEEVSTSLYVIDERTGRQGALPKPKKDYLFGTEANVKEELKKINEEQWTTSLSNVSIAATRGTEAIESLHHQLERTKGVNGLEDKDLQKIYKLSKSKEGQNFINSLNPEAKKLAEGIIDNVNYGDVFIRDSYRSLQNLYNEAYYEAERTRNKKTLGRLDEFKEEIAPLMKKYKDEPEKVIELGRAITKGIQLLDSIEAPQTLKPLEDFAIDKASETFANVAFKGYEKFRDKAPIISIENPPVGMGMTRAEELNKLIKETRNKFVEKAKEKGISESEAKEQADKLIGATWDVGHINMLRQYGYGEEHLKKQFEQMAPYIKHLHLSDNFGMSHSELPMGMGNVPMKSYEELLKKYGDKVKNIKRIMEAGDWVQQFGGVSPFSHTLQNYGSPIFAMDFAPYWNQSAGAGGGYYSGQGPILPDIHFRTYGSGFDALPIELGGQMTGRDRLTGGATE